MYLNDGKQQRPCEVIQTLRAIGYLPQPVQTTHPQVEQSLGQHGTQSRWVALLARKRMGLGFKLAFRTLIAALA